MKISIRTRLMIWYCVVFCLSVGLLEVGVYFGVKGVTTRLIDNELGIRMNGFDSFLRDHLQRLPLSRVVADIPPHVGLQPNWAILQNAEHQTLFCGTAVQELCGSPVPEGTHSLVHAGSRLLRYDTVTETIRGIRYTAFVATDLRFRRELLQRFRLMVVVIVPVTLIIATVGGLWLSKRAFAPVREIIESVQSINERRLGLRLRVPNTGDEIQLLSETLNGMFARVESSFQKVTELTANASHELRTPMAVIRTASEVALLSPQASAEVYREALLQILAESEKNTRLLDTLLMLARSDAGAQNLEVTSVDLEENVRKAVEACRYLADTKHVALILHVRSEHLTVWADDAQLHRLWLLLIDNAVKYTPAGGGVEITLHRTSDGRPCCEVRDTGIGIPKEDLSNIFHRFYRSKNATSQSGIGAGLGLTMVQWIANVHSATLSVTSEIGKGSCFRIAFPLPDRKLKNTVEVQALQVNGSSESSNIFS